MHTHRNTIEKSDMSFATRAWDRRDWQVLDLCNYFSRR